VTAFEAWLAGLEPPAEPAEPAPREVPNSPEFRRIRDAERVDWAADPRLVAGAAALSALFKTPSGQQTLYLIQAAALKVLHDLGSCFAPLRTSHGKTLPGFLAAEVIEAERPLLIVPAKLINSGKTHREHAKYRAHWRLRPIMGKKESRARRSTVSTFAPLRVVSYETLGRDEYTGALEDWAPDLVVLDECHKCKDPSSAVTRKLSRFARTFHPRMLLMTGSCMNRSIGEFAHLLRWCLGDGAPLPREWMELQFWKWAIDEKVTEAMEIAPGALLDLSPADPEDEGLSDKRKARRRFARRLRSTVGVVASGDDLPEVVLTARVEKRKPTPEMLDVVKHMRDHWETPCGHPFELATELWAHERQASCDFYYRWDQQPPLEWKIARKNWSAFVREILSHSRSLDSPMAVANAIDRGQLNDYGGLAEWRRVAHMFNPIEHQEPVFFGDSTTNFCADWLAKEKGICWVVHVAFGKRLSEVTGVPYFSAGGKAGKVAIDEHRGPAIASVKAINEGFNLHELHHKNLFSTCPTTNLENEQAISRTHRDGQPEDVEVTYLVTLEGDAKALAQARADAAAVCDATGSPQRLSIATWLDE
jgi:hypothetical protein